MVMEQRITKKTIRLFASVGVIVTVGFVLYAALPLKDNYRIYQDISDHLLLAVIVAWVSSPYLFLYLSASRLSPHRIKNFFRVAVALLICIWSIGVGFDTIFNHSDAQFGIFILFLPIYQWVVIGVLEIALYLVRPQYTA